ncbi:MAG TPA: succinate dehydrogenase cytochrome b subunit [Verrucomicrobiae bacterium]|nr:succinate dehydrogenase cytochrome b subunit [Verrucomicrobiae bacterium]
MNMIAHLFKSSLGKKYIMAITGFFMFLFVIAHLVGNLQIFLGPEVINRYGNFLQTNLELVWPARLILLTFLVLHIWSASKLSIENKAARPEGYAVYQPIGSAYASRTMFMSGIIAFFFIVYHLLHYTAEVKYVNLTGQNFATFIDAQGRHDIFRMMVVGFNNGWVCAFYIVGVGLLCLHLSHGASSMFQSMGWNSDAYRPFLANAGRILALLIFIGYASIPLSILCGYGRQHLNLP